MTKSISELIVDAYNTGTDATFIGDDGRQYYFNPQGIKEYLEGGGQGTKVTSVNKKQPDADGDVELTYSDVGAASPKDIPTGRKLVPDGGAEGALLTIVNSTPTWAPDQIDVLKKEVKDLENVVDNLTASFAQYTDALQQIEKSLDVAHETIASVQTDLIANTKTIQEVDATAKTAESASSSALAQIPPINSALADLGNRVTALENKTE